MSRFSPGYPRSVIINLPTRAERVQVLSHADGSVEVRTPGGTETIPPRVPVPEETWNAATPQAAAAAVLAAADQVESSPAARVSLCAAGEPLLLFGYGDEQSTVRGCGEQLGLTLFGPEGQPRPVSSQHRGFRLRVEGDEAVLETTMVHRFRPGRYYRHRRAVVRARVLLLRGPNGLWGLLAPDDLLPTAALDYRYKPATDRLLTAQARYVRRLEHEQANELAVSAPLASAPPCSTQVRPLPAGDVTVDGTDGVPLSRTPFGHGFADLVGYGAGDGCVTIRTAGPLPASFDLRVQGDSGPILHVIQWA